MQNTPKPLPSIDYLRECFNYDPMTGTLTWKERPIHHFKTQRARNIINAKMTGKIAAKAPNAGGYFVVGINKTPFYAHRICFALANGDFDQSKEIDHVNHNRQDNRAENLRAVTGKQNSQNQKRRSTNKSGITGVSWNKDREKWTVRLLVNNSYKFFGEHDSKEKAVEARIAALQKHGFHANHGL